METESSCEAEGLLLSSPKKVEGQRGQERDKDGLIWEQDLEGFIANAD